MSISLDLNIDGWTQLQGYPEFNGDETGVSMVDKYAADIDDSLFKSIPAIKSEYPSLNLSTASNSSQTLQLVRYNVKFNGNGEKALITLNYVPPSTADSAPDEKKPYYYLQNGTISVPISKLSNYLTCWDHYLFGLSDSPTPDWWDTATSATLTKAQVSTYLYSWGKSISEKPANNPDKSRYFSVIKEPTKKIEQYLQPSPVVQECIWYASVKSAGKAAKSVSKIVTPNQTFGVSGGAWLVMSAGVGMDGGRYKVERQFQWAPEWDTDIYAEG